MCAICSFVFGAETVDLYIAARESKRHLIKMASYGDLKQIDQSAPYVVCVSSTQTHLRIIITRARE
jgi:hypothetical protein